MTSTADQPREAHDATTVAVAGAGGRLGSFVCEVVSAHPNYRLVARLGSASAAGDGKHAAVLCDVTHPDVSPMIVERALRRGQRVIVGTSGWSAERLTRLRQLTGELPNSGVLVVPNFSLGSVLGTLLARTAAPYFESVEIVEAHHPAKRDSPSGTAVRTAELIAADRARAAHSNTELNAAAPFTEQPARGVTVAGIPVHSLRIQGTVARQEVHFGGIGEELTVTHVTHSQESYRAGILAAFDAVKRIEGVVVGLEQVLGFPSEKMTGLHQQAAAPSGPSE